MCESSTNDTPMSVQYVVDGDKISFEQFCGFLDSLEKDENSDCDVSMGESTDSGDSMPMLCHRSYSDSSSDSSLDTA